MADAPYVPIQYPKWVYPAHGKPFIVNSKEEHDALTIEVYGNSADAAMAATMPWPEPKPEEPAPVEQIADPPEEKEDPDVETVPEIQIKDVDPHAPIAEAVQPVEAATKPVPLPPLSRKRK